MEVTWLWNWVTHVSISLPLAGRNGKAEELLQYRQSLIRSQRRGDSGFREAAPQCGVAASCSLYPEATPTSPPGEQCKERCWGNPCWVGESSQQATLRCPAEHLASSPSHAGNKGSSPGSGGKLPAALLQPFRTLQSKSTGFLNCAF